MAAPSLPDDKMYLLLFENRTVQTGAPSWALVYVEVQRLLTPSQIYRIQHHVHGSLPLAK